MKALNYLSCNIDSDRDVAARDSLPRDSAFEPRRIVAAARFGLGRSRSRVA